MFLVLELEPKVEEVVFDEYFHVEGAYSWVTEAGWTLVLQIIESEWTDLTMPAEDELPAEDEPIFAMDFCSEEFGL